MYMYIYKYIYIYILYMHSALYRKLILRMFI